MRLTLLRAAAALILTTACGAEDAGAGGGTTTTSAGGGATSATAASSTSAATTGGGGAGGGGGEEGAGGSDAVFAAIATIDNCAGSRIVGPLLPDEAGVIALGRFTFAELPVTLETFSYVTDVARGQCADLATELIYFASSNATPSDEPTDARVVVVPPSGGGDASIALTPPLTLTRERPFAFVGVRMAADGDRSICVVGCPGSERADDNWWSSAPAAPFGWDRLVDSAPNDDPDTPGDGLAWDYVFAVSGRIGSSGM